MRTRRKAPYPGQEVLPTDALTCSARSRGSGLGWGGVVAHCRIPSTCSQECTVHPQDQRRSRAMVGFGLYLVRETGRRKAHRFDPDPPAPPKPGAIRLPLLIPPSPPATLQLPSAQNKRGLEALPSRGPHHGSGEEQGIKDGQAAGAKTGYTGPDSCSQRGLCTSERLPLGGGVTAPEPHQPTENSRSPGGHHSPSPAAASRSRRGSTNAPIRGGWRKRSAH